MIKSEILRECKIQVNKPLVTKLPSPYISDVLHHVAVYISHGQLSCCGIQ